jgi:hypothetical protein
MLYQDRRCVESHDTTSRLMRNNRRVSLVEERQISCFDRMEMCACR